MAMKENDVPEPSDSTFVSNLAFLTDLTDHLIMLNLKRHAPNQIIMFTYNSAKSFK